MINEFKNLLSILNNYELWLNMARSKLRTRYLRTKLGPLWEIFGTCTLLLCIAFIWSKLWKEDFLKFFPYLFFGYIIWKTIVSVVNEATMLFSEIYKNLLENVYIHPFTLCVAIVCKNFIVLIGFVICSFLILIFTKKVFLLSIIFVIIYLFLFFISAISLTLLLATLCLKFRDMQHAINVILSLVFFFTPIIWNADQLSEVNKKILVDSNIVYHYIEFFRSSLLFGHPETKNFLVVVISTLILLMSSLYISRKFSRKLTLWLI
jgi:ABC-type polysaccharide/polyol phosphate export permease